MIEQIKEAILKSLPDAEVYVIDPYNDGEHFQSIVVSPSFEGKTLVEQHKLVMKPLKEAFESHVHALALKTYTPDKWELDKDKYPI